MSAAAPWSVKGIDPKAREVAKDLARRSGMTLGEWLNRVILEDDLPDEVTVETQFSDRLHRTSPSVPRLLSSAGSPDLSRIAHALDRITDRIEASETRTGLAINGVEHSMRQAMARIETAERAQHGIAVRLEGVAGAAVDAAPRYDDRGGPTSSVVQRALQADASAVNAEVLAEAVLKRMGERLAAAEGRTAVALADLKGLLAAMDRRVGAIEAPDAARFEALGQSLERQVEAVRAEVADKLEASAGPRVEARLAAMAQTVQTAERRSTRAVEDIGRQVLSMAEAVSRKLGDVDQRSADAIDQVGTEVARIAGAVEHRLARVEHTQAEAFERLGFEISRVNLALAAKPSVFEREVTETETPRETDSAATIGVAVPLELGEADRITAVLDAVAPLSEPDKLAMSEASAGSAEPVVDEPVEGPDLQTAALLEEARQRLGLPPEPEPEQADARYGAALFSRAAPDVETPADPPPNPHGWSDARSETVDAPWRRLDLDVAEDEPPQGFAPITESAEGGAEESTDESLFSPASPRPTEPELSTREVIDRARAAARAANGAASVEMHAKVEQRSASGRLFQGFGGRPPRRERSSGLQTALMIAGGAAFLSVGAAGLTLMEGPITAPAAEIASLSPNPGPIPRAAMALSQGAIPQASAPVYAKVRADVEAGVPGAMAELKALAASDHLQAQLYLAQLYDLGDAGLPRDPAEARRLISLAAENGEPQAMHNLGVFYFRGEGGAQDLASAAQWFRKAAATGVVESQYNLGLMYQTGSGVTQDYAQARQWFSQAAAKGDAEAKRALADLDKKPVVLTPRAAAAAKPATTASLNVRQSQQILTRLGYYEGPADGYANAAYRSALLAYQSDQSASSSGPRPHVVQR